MAQPNQYTAIKDKRERFAHYVDPQPTDEGCYLWQGSKHPSGYGYFRDGKRNVRAHRWAWEDANGPIPANMTVHHKCFVRLCVNPTHLELMPHAENARFANKSGHCPTCTCQGKRAA